MKRVCKFSGTLCFLWQILFAINGFAQEYGSKEEFFVDPAFTLNRWTVGDGLPVNSINQIIQSEDSYLWLVTFDSLVHFEGVRFKVFRSDEYPDLPSNRIHRMAKSADDVLWLQLEGDGLVKFTDEKFQPRD